MSFGDDGIWDEFRWEEFMRRQEKQLDKYFELLYKCPGDPDHEKKIAEVMGWSQLPDFMNGIEEEEELEGEMWKRIAGYEEYDDHHAALERLTAFRLARDFALTVHEFVDSLSPELKEDSTVVEVLSQALVVPGKIAGGFEMGTEIDVLGGNIATCKRALEACNQVVKLLLQLKTRGIVPGGLYNGLARGAAEVRNTVAVHVVDLRELFRSGLP